MAEKNGTSGAEKSGLEQAMILLLQNQTAFQSQIIAMNERMDTRFARIDKRFARIDERFERIESELREIGAILHTLEGLPETLAALPEAIREKIGFKRR